ncbi:hypothetical protein ACFL5Z_04160 [Planctomycetota bacterium]
MNKVILFCAGVILIVSCSAVRADLSSEFSGYNAIWEVGVSGLQSSYHSDTKSGITLPDYMFSLGPQRVSYPHGIGQIPSPGGSVGRAFDEGVLGIRAQGGDVVIQVAGALNPLTGYYYSGWRAWYGQGDVFLTVEDSAGIAHFALLNSWPRSASGSYRTLNGGHFDAARDFHMGAGGGANLQGHLVSLLDVDDVGLTGGKGSYYPGYKPSPKGLDYRVFAQGGVDIGDAGLVHSQMADFGQDWFIQTWTFPTSWLSSDSVFTIGLHKAASCGNDQIGMVTVVPAPGAFLLGLAGFGTIGFIKRMRMARIRRVNV